MLTSFSAFIAACILGRWGDAAGFRVRFNLLLTARLLTARLLVVACRRLLTVFLRVAPCPLLLLHALALLLVARGRQPVMLGLPHHDL